ncbi:MAG: 3-dehydroquinate synthase [Clostridia bacterium]|nr:3-dehydroquinate synthase [Clostridia bacterium]
MQNHSYQIQIENSYDMLQSAMGIIEGIEQKKICIITDSNVEKLYLNEVKDKISSICKSCEVFSFEAGESSKNLRTIEQIYTFLIEKQFNRSDLLVALGGGVVGDMTGFAAATYMRGIHFIQLPTTLLAQVDSSIGGKTGVDCEQYKNMIGAFWMPDLVYINTHVLHSLPQREFACGMAEVLKSALIKRASFYEWLVSNFYEINEKEIEILNTMIYETCTIKKIIVEKDPFEKGERAALNFGHTIGHAIEKYKNFELLHGECVALGCVAAAFISWKKELLSMEEYYEIRDMFVPFGLPISLENIDLETIITLTKSDKKASENGVKFVLLKKIGKAMTGQSVTDEEMMAALNEIYYKEEDMYE